MTLHGAGGAGQEIALCEVDASTIEPGGFKQHQLLSVGRFYRLLKPYEGSSFAPTILKSCPASDEASDVRWRQPYTQVAEYGSMSASTHAIMIVGMNLAEGTTDAEVEEFNDFYSTVHIKDMCEVNGFHRALRWEIQLGTPAFPDLTRYLATYEANEATTARWTSSDDWPPLSDKPDVWGRLQMAWLLWYQPIIFPADG